MRAVIINRYGSANVMELADVPQPRMNNRQVLVRVHAAGVNPVDYKMRSGQIKFISGSKFPIIPGADFSGEIVEIGNSVDGFKISDAVYGTIKAYKGGAYAEYVCADSQSVAIKPASLSFADAASLPIAALTALQSIRNLGKIAAGQSVLINGASGGVGVYAVQIAKALGASVTAVCSERNTEFVRLLGSDRIIDYNRQSYLDESYKYDLFFDVVSNQPVSEAFKVLKSKGIYVMTLPDLQKLIYSVFTYLLRGKKIKIILVKARQSDLLFLNELIEGGKLKAVVEKQFPLKEVRQAHRDMESGHTRGKIVLTLG